MNRISHHSTFILLLLLSVAVTAAKPSVSVDSLSGKVEIQRSGTVEWKQLTRELKIYNNDIVRVSDSGLAVLQWPNGSQTFVHKKSQVLVSISQTKENKIATNASVMLGAAFFVIKKVLPKDPSDNMRIYTPTAVLSLRGTSFLIQVDSTRTNTSIKMFNGTVIVKNVKNNISVVLGTPYKSEIEINSNPTTPRVMLQDEIDSLKLWVPSHIVANEIASQLEKAKKDQISLIGDVEEKCIVMQFIDNSGYKGPWKIGQEITRQFASTLRNHISRLIVMVADSSTENPINLSKTQNARYVLIGTIDTFDIAQHASISATADNYKESIVAKVNISIKLFDTAKNQELCNESFSADTSGRNNIQNTWKELQKMSYSLGDSTFAQTIIGLASVSAIEKAIQSSAKFLRE